MTAITKPFQTTAGGEVVIPKTDLGISSASMRAVVNVFVSQGNVTGTGKTVEVSDDGLTYYPIYYFGGSAWTSINIKNIILKTGFYLKIKSAGTDVISGIVTGFYETDE